MERNLLVKQQMSIQHFIKQDQKKLRGSGSKGATASRRFDGRQENRSYRRQLRWDEFDDDSVNARNWDPYGAREPMFSGPRANFSSTFLMDELGFVNSKCQLLLYPHSTLHGLIANIDSGVPWKDIALVTYTPTEMTKCPICMDVPLLPRMGMCGHTYCWHCMLQYIKYENSDLHKKCAVCKKDLHAKDLKRVKLEQESLPQVNEQLELILVRRSEKSPIVLPIVSRGRTLELDCSRDVDTNKFTRTLLATSTNITDLIQSDLKQLLMFQEQCKSDCSTVELLPLLEEMKSNLNLELLNDAAVNEVCSHNSMPNTSTIEVTDGKIFTYYQASSGQDIYLHSINWRCLLSEYKDVANLPLKICAKIIDSEQYATTVESRKRWRYLNHLPIGRPFTFVELELLPPLVSETTMTEFSSALESRVCFRRHKLLEDIRLTKAKEAAENRLQSLPEGCTLTGHADLGDRVPCDADFMPLTETPSNLLPATFADVSMKGAWRFVDRNRVANFGKQLVPLRPTEFNVNAEFWPELCNLSPPATSTTIWSSKGFEQPPDPAVGAKKPCNGEFWPELSNLSPPATSTTIWSSKGFEQPPEPAVDANKPCNGEFWPELSNLSPSAARTTIWASKSFEKSPDALADGSRSCVSVTGGDPNPNINSSLDVAAKADVKTRRRKSKRISHLLTDLSLTANEE